MRQSLLVFATLVLAASVSAQPRSDLQGAWDVVEVTTSGPKAATIKSQPGLFLFTARHYSIVRVTSPTARPRPKDPTKMTEAEALAIWGPLQAQSGTYEVGAGMLNLRPVVAKNPGVMQAGNKPDVFAFTLQADSLTLVQKSGNGEPIANPITLRLKRVE